MTSTSDADTAGRVRPRACIVRQVDRVESALQRDAAFLVEAGYDVDLVTMRIDGAEKWAELPDGVRVVPLPVRRRRGGIAGYAFDYVGFTLLAGAVVAWRHLRRPYALVQTISLPDVLVVAGLVPRVTGAALVLRIAEPTPQLSAALGHPRWVQRLLGRLQIWSARRADHVLTVTDELAEDLVARGLDRAQVSVVLNVPGPTLEDARPGERPDPGRFTAISHGSVFERYGHDTIVQAIALARDDVPGLRLVLTGSGPYLPSVLELAAELGVEDIVEHHEWLELPALAAALARSDVGIVAQRANAYSHLVNTNKMFEYLMLGIPALCTRLRATERLLPSEADVVRYFESDDAEGLAGLLRELAHDGAARRSLSERGREVWATLGTDGQRRRYHSAIARARLARRWGRPSTRTGAAEGVTPSS